MSHIMVDGEYQYNFLDNFNDIILNNSYKNYNLNIEIEEISEKIKDIT